AQVAAALAGETIFIADGHHRYETALAYRAELGADGRRSVLAFLANMEEPGLVVLPTHRLLRVPLRLAPADVEAPLRGSLPVAAPAPAAPAGALAAADPPAGAAPGRLDRRRAARPPAARAPAGRRARAPCAASSDR